MSNAIRRALVITPLALGAVAVAVGSSGAAPAQGVTPTLLARGEFPEFSVKSDRHGNVDYQAKSRTPLDLVVRKHSYAPGGNTGWHSHPGPVFVTVVKGSLTFYEYVDGECRSQVLTARDGFQPGYVDEGRGHYVRNESGATAEDVSVITAPRSTVFRAEIPDPVDCPPSS